VSETRNGVDGQLAKGKSGLWLAALLFGILLVLLTLILAWGLRVVTPGGASIQISTFEASAPVVRRPLDTTQFLHSSFAELRSDRDRLTEQLAALGRELEHRSQQCQPVASAPLPPALPADRWRDKDLGILEGCWQLGKDAPSVRGDLGNPFRETCTSKVGRICFDQNGIGEREQTISCPRAGTIFCRAPITAQFGSEGSFRTTQPDVICQGGASTKWHSRTLTCRRVSDDHAVCLDSGRPELGLPAQEQEFRRAP